MRVLSLVLLLSSALVACGYPELPKLTGGGDGGMTPDAPGGCTGGGSECGADNALYECNEASGTLTKVQDCQHGCSVDHCNACAANTTFCDGDELAMCDGNGNIVNPMTCANGCQASRCNACKPGVSSCDGSGNAVPCGLDGMPGTAMACGANGCISGVCNTCQPNTVTCQGDTLVTCGGNGMVQATTACTFGCGTSPNAHCKVFAPSYGLTAPTGTLPDLVIDMNSTLDIAGCANSSATLRIGTTSTTLVSPQVSNVAQTGGSPICVVRFRNITVNAGYTLSITNDAATGNVLSLQATNDVTIAGTITFTNVHNGPAPGASVQAVSDGTTYNAPGAGGAGGARAGGNGGACTGCTGVGAAGVGGAAITNIRTVLKPGSQGGSTMIGTIFNNPGGAGGGAIHLLSLTRVSVASTGKLVLNGGGVIGNVNTRALGAGGGSGGALVIEAPTVNFSTSALAVANGGGAAGGCPMCVGSPIPTCTHANGENGQLSATRATGGNCGGTGNGGWEANGETVPSVTGTNGSASTQISGGGGGGSNGFIFLRAKTGANVMVTAGAVISPAPAIEAVTAN